jgi:carboxymethylenebutenolidase
MTAQTVIIPALSGGSFSAYLAAPSTQPRAAIVLIQEILGVNQMKASLSFLRQYPSTTGKVGSLGFCLGGKLAYLMATRTDADANVSYYGVDIDKYLAEATKIRKPLILHMDENDEYVSPTAQVSIQQGLKDNPLVTIYRYEGVSHGFSRMGSSAYRKEAAELSRDRTLAFLKQHLG